MGILHTHNIEHKLIKSTLNEEFENRLECVLKRKLNSKNLTTAIKSYAITALQFSFGIVNWTRTDLEAINRKIRTELTKYRKHHANASIERISLPRERRGRGIRDVMEAYGKQIQNLRSFFHQQNGNLHQIIVKVDKAYTTIKLKG